jgi:hypothetical protein
MIVDAVKTNQALRSRAHSVLSRRVRLGTVVLAPTAFAMMLILTVVTLRAGGPELDLCEMLLMLLHMATLIGFPALYAAICPVDFPEGGAGYVTYVLILWSASCVINAAVCWGAMAEIHLEGVVRSLVSA